MKHCKHCNLPKSLKLFSKNKNNKDGLQSWCKDCMKQYHQDNKDSINQRQKTYAAEHPEVGRLAAERWRKNHPELYKARIEDWRSRNQERIKETTRAWYENNKEKASEASKAWWAANPEKSKVYYNNRRALIIGVEATLTQEEWNEIWTEFDGKCFWCNGSATAMDHIVPLQPRNNGTRGHHIKSNVVPACLPCNSKKSNKDPLVYLWESRQIP